MFFFHFKYTEIIIHLFQSLKKNTWGLFLGLFIESLCMPVKITDNMNITVLLLYLNVYKYRNGTLSESPTSALSTYKHSPVSINTTCLLYSPTNDSTGLYCCLHRIIKHAGGTTNVAPHLKRCADSKVTLAAHSAPCCWSNVLYFQGHVPTQLYWKVSILVLNLSL